KFYKIFSLLIQNSTFKIHNFIKFSLRLSKPIHFVKRYGINYNMEYESPTVEMLGEGEMADVQGEGFIAVFLIALVVVAAFKAAAVATNAVYAVNVGAQVNVGANLNVVWNRSVAWNRTPRGRRYIF
ncbi:MAG: hypothetical protein AB1397_07540, partial [bacterium]